MNSWLIFVLGTAYGAACAFIYVALKIKGRQRRDKQFVHELAVTAQQQEKILFWSALHTKLYNDAMTALENGDIEKFQLLDKQMAQVRRRFMMEARGKFN